MSLGYREALYCGERPFEPSLTGHLWEGTAIRALISSRQLPAIIGGVRWHLASESPSKCFEKPLSTLRVVLPFITFSVWLLIVNSTRGGGRDLGWDREGVWTTRIPELLC